MKRNQHSMQEGADSFMLIYKKKNRVGESSLSHIHDADSLEEVRS